MLIQRSEQPLFEADLLYAITAVPEPETEAIRLYYLLRHRGEGSSCLCMARSVDGLQWERPDFGDGTNVVMRGCGHDCDWGMFLPKRILYDPREDDDGARWKMLFWDCPGSRAQPGLCLAVSPDGVSWSALGDGPAISSANDAASFVRVNPNAPSGPLEATYLLYQQTWKYNPALPTERDNLKGLHRRISVWTARRFEAHAFGDGWVGPTTVLEPDTSDPPDLQYYWLSAYHTKYGYGGLLNCHHTATQEMDVRLLRSTDGWEWEFLNDRKPLIAPGDRGRFDCGMVSALSPPVVIGRRAYLFYNGRATVHDHAPRYPKSPLPEPSAGIGVCVFDAADFDLQGGSR
jgi:hypothetical protein